MNFQKPLPPAPMLPSRGQTTESGFVPVTPSWLSYSATHAPKVLQNPRFYRQNDATATQHGGLFSQFCFCKCFSPTLQKLSILLAFFSTNKHCGSLWFSAGKFKLYLANHYRKVASSRLVYYSILNYFDQRSQYMSIKFPLHKKSDNP